MSRRSPGKAAALLATLATLALATWSGPADAWSPASCPAPYYDALDRTRLPPVSDEDYAAACRDWAEGVHLERDGFRQRALPLLERSLARWDVPRTRLGLARALTNLERHPEALIHAWQALRLEGHGLLDAELEALAAIIDDALAQGVVHVDLEITDAATVHVGEDLVLHGPARWSGLVPAGRIWVVVRYGQTVSFDWTREIAGGQRLGITWPTSPGSRPPPTGASADPWPTRPFELAELTRALLGFEVRIPRPADHRSSPLPPRSRPAPPLTSGAPPIPPAPLPHCARVRGAEAKRLCELHAADLALFRGRLRTVETLNRQLLDTLRGLTR